MDNGELRIVWRDRGEQMVASKKERWVPYEDPRPPLRTEECLEVALEADRALQAIVRHEPRRFWDKVDLGAEPFDKGLVDAILAYLAGRLGSEP